MKKKSLLVLAIFLLFVGLVFAADTMKIIEFGPHKYMVSELAPDFSTWDFSLVGQTQVTPEPNPCSLFVIEGSNPDKTVWVMVLIVRENDKTYVGGIIVSYIATNTSDCYEDLQYLSGGKPSFVLTKTEHPSDISKFIQLRQMQLRKKVAI